MEFCADRFLYCVLVTDTSYRGQFILMVALLAMYGALLMIGCVFRTHIVKVDRCDGDICLMAWNICLLQILASTRNNIAEQLGPEDLGLLIEEMERAQAETGLTLVQNEKARAEAYLVHPVIIEAITNARLEVESHAQKHFEPIIKGLERQAEFRSKYFGQQEAHFEKTMSTNVAEIRQKDQEIAKLRKQIKSFQAFSSLTQAAMQ